jgi:hypothetical protein
MSAVILPEFKKLKNSPTWLTIPLHRAESMAVSESDLPPFLKRNATLEETQARDLEWNLLEVLASKNDGILGLRLIEVGGAKDVVHLLIAPDCRRKVLAANIEIPEVANGARNKPKEEPGHFIPVLAARLEQTAWWHQEMAPRIRAEYFRKRSELFDGPSTRAVTPAELAEIAAIKGHTPDSGSTTSHERTVLGRSVGNREIKDAVMDWLKARRFDEITPAMVGIGKLGGDSQKLVEITLPTKSPTAPLVRKLKGELEKAGIHAEPVCLTNSMAFRFASSLVDRIEQ